MARIIQQNRYYPGYYPRFEGEPTRSNFKIVKDKLCGEGIIALNAFNPGDMVFRFIGLLVPEISLYTLQYDENQHLFDPFFMGKVLHSCNPNMSCDMKSQTFSAIQPINPGDFITMDYEETEDVLFRSFICNCGSHNCRGLIRGKKCTNIAIHKIAV